MSCKNDDDGSNSLESCCDIPPLQAEFADAKAYLPNAFTPNGDGINDIFYVQGGESLEKVNSFQVFDGSTIIFDKNEFFPNDTQLGWNGRVLGNSFAEDGVYRYKVTLSSSSNEVAEFEGEVCLRSGFPYSCVDLESQCGYGIQHDGDGGFDITFQTGETCE